MTQYDLILTQNVHATGTEFSEKLVNLTKGGILSASGATKIPTVLAVGTNGYMLVADSTETTGLKWVAQPDITALLAAADVMVFKGTVGADGTLTIAEFNDLVVYNAGWTYKIIEAGTVKSRIVEIGDMASATVDRATDALDADWAIWQGNTDGLVMGPASAIDSHVAVFDGTTGKIIKDGGVLGTAAAAAAGDFATASQGTLATNAVPNSLYTEANTILIGTGASTPETFIISEGRLVGRLTGGTLGELAPYNVMNVIISETPATSTSTGTVNQIAFDANYFYHCTVADTWARVAMATTW